MTVENITPQDPSDRIAELEHDNEKLYWLLGAYTEIIDTLPPISKKHCINSLKAKAERTTDPDHATLLRSTVAVFESPTG